MKLELSVDMDNAAFMDEQDHGVANGNEVARILRKVADRVEGALSIGDTGRMRDINGNSCGGFEIVEG